MPPRALFPVGPDRPLALVGEHPFVIDILHGTGFRVKSCLKGADGVKVREWGVAARTTILPLASTSRQDGSVDGCQPS